MSATPPLVMKIFRAVQHPVIVFFHSGGADAARIRAGTRFGQTVCTNRRTFRQTTQVGSARDAEGARDAREASSKAAVACCRSGRGTVTSRNGGSRNRSRVAVDPALPIVGALPQSRDADLPATAHSITIGPLCSGVMRRQTTSGIMLRKTSASTQNVSATASMAACLCTSPYSCPSA